MVVSLLISTNGKCYTSVLTIPAVQALNEDGDTRAVVGSDTLKITGELQLYTILDESIIS